MTLSSASSSSALGKRGLEHGGASPSAASVGHLSPARSSHAGTPPWGENGIPQAQQLQVDSGARPAKRPRAEDGGSPALRPSPLSASSLPEPLQSHSEEMRTSVERERSPAGAKERGASLPPSPSASQKMDYSQPDPAGTLQPAISSNYHGIPRHPPSMFDSEPFDDVVRVISLFLRPFIGRPNLEIEAKLGVLVDKNTNNRLFLGIDTEAGGFEIGRNLLAQHVC